MRQQRLHSKTRWIWMAALGALLLAGPASAQSTRELRQENERLRAQMRDMEEQLQAARQQIAELEEQIRQLQTIIQNMREGGPDEQAPSEEPAYSVALDDPQASPHGLFNTLKASYNKQFEDMDVGEAGSRTRAQYMRALQQWRAKMNRMHRQRVQWHIRVIEALRAGRSPVLRVMAIDPKTEADLGRPFEIDVPRHLTNTLRDFEQSQGLEHVVMTAVLTPRVMINESRAEPGTFNNPPLIGPYAEFGFTVNPRAFLTVEQAAEQKEKKQNQGRNDQSTDSTNTTDEQDNDS